MLAQRGASGIRIAAHERREDLFVLAQAGWRPAGTRNNGTLLAADQAGAVRVIDPVTGVHTEINEYGPRVTEGEVDLLLEKLRYLARASRCIVLAGSLPRDVDADRVVTR